MQIANLRKIFCSLLPTHEVSDTRVAATNLWHAACRLARLHTAGGLADTARIRISRIDDVNDLSFSGFLVRAALSLVLVLLTFNPSGYSYVHMVADGFPSITPVEAVLGILLLIGWIVFLGATLRSIGLVGMVLAFALCAALIWMIVSWGWVSLENTSALTWIGLVVLALIMAIGMAWAHLYRRWTGQTTVDEVNEGQ